MTIIMNGVLTFVLTIMLACTSLYSSATEHETDALKEIMTSLENAYGQYSNRNREPISVPETIISQYQALTSTPDPSPEKLDAFIRETEQNIANFHTAAEFQHKSDNMIYVYEMRLLKRGIKYELPDTVLAIDNTYFDIIENPAFTGADILAYEKRYYAAMQDHTKDIFKVLDDVSKLYDIGHVLSRRVNELSETERSDINESITEFDATVNESRQLLKNKKWSLASSNIQLGITLGNHLDVKIGRILDNRHNQKKALVERHHRLKAEWETLNSHIEKLTDKIDRYEDKLDSSCTQTIVDYSCADSCPKIRKLDVIFKYYKDEPDFQCLSQCSHEERQAQADYDRETEDCENYQHRIIAKANDLIEEKNNLSYRYNQILDELRSIESNLSTE
ncbi:hypothetical protein WNY58_14115 [Neptuniibacter pectenicola]|uniref:Uncharacterized protein n=1 Tax=Neptuniibacter pectenicola TaxID=1806669 RepID=A0ABU9TUY5_9GAMM